MREYKNILVHCLVNMGDVVLATGAIALLKEVCPEAKITVMVKPAMAELMLNNPVVDDIFIFKYKEKKKSLLGMWHFVKEIRKRHFDLSISLDRKLRPAILTYLAGIPVRLGADRLFDNKKSWLTVLYTHTVHTPDDFLRTHQSELFQSVIRGFFGKNGVKLPAIANITEQHKNRAKELFASLIPSRKRIALCVKGTYYLKNWPLEKFAQLIHLLNERYQANFFIVGAPEDREYAENLIALSNISVKNWCGQTSLLELAAVLDQSDLFITIDTGGMHIAATTNVPIIGLFRCVSTRRWMPLSSKGYYVEKRLKECPTVKSPEECPMKYCVEDIEVEEVYQAVIQVLDE